jgi:hypothetical protein
MSTIKQLNPTLYVETPMGAGIAHLVIDYGIEHSLKWLVILEDGRFFEVPNEELRGCTNYTMGRKNPEKLKQEKS